MKTCIKFTSIFLLALLLFSCKKPPALNLPEPPNPFPKLTTGVISAVTFSSAVGGGNISSEGAMALTAVGVCWDVNPNPTTLNSKTNNGAGVGSYASNITGLTPSTTYYVRAYATNGYGTAYGEQVSFTTSRIWTLVKSGLDFRQIVSTPLGIYGFNEGAYPFLYYSSDNAVNWTSCTPSPLQTIWDLKQKDSYLFSGGVGGVYTSTDNGNNWQKAAALPLGMDNNRVSTMEFVGNDLFVGVSVSTGGIYRSSDNGNSWSISDIGIPALTNIGKLWLNAGTIWAGTSIGLYKSSDNGANWILSNSGMPNDIVYDFAAIGTKIYARTWLNGVYSSDDNGANWTALNNGLPVGNKYIRSICSHNNDLYLSYDNAGVYVLASGSTTWTLFNPGLTSTNFNYSMVVKNNTLYLCEKPVNNFPNGKIYKYDL